MRKLIQRQVFSFLGTRWGTALCVLGVFFTINSALRIAWGLLGGW